jgi:Tfp pilus assembly protein PilO
MAANDWSERTRMIVTIAVIVVVNVGLGAGLYSLRNQWLKLDAEHKKLLAEKQKLDDFVKQGPDRDRELTQYTERFDKQAKLLPESSEVATLMSDLAKIGDSTGCKNLNMAGGAASGAGSNNYAREVWKSRWDGDFMSWCKLMNEIEERFPRFVAFEGLQINPANSGMVLTGAVHQITVDIVTYRYVRPVGE